jgi:hypothetical protein
MTKVYTALKALFVAVTAVIIYQFMHEQSTGAEMHEEPSSDIANPELSPIQMEILQLIDKLKFTLFEEIDGKITSQFQPLSQRNARVLHWEDESTVVSAVQSRTPHIILNSPATQWRAQKWELWDFTLRLPVILGVVVTRSGDCIWIQDDREPGGMITTVPEESIVSAIEEEFFFVNFVASFQNPSIRMYYSTNYKILEGVLNVR